MTDHNNNNIDTSNNCHSSNLNSPVHFGMSGNFSADDIHELLGFIPTDHSEQAHHHSHESQDIDDHELFLSTDHSHHQETEIASSNGSTNAVGGGDVAVPGGCSTVVTTSTLSGNVTSAASTTNLHEDTRAQARSERKRSREKQRRNDVNRQFAELTDVLKRIELDESQNRKGTGTGSNNGGQNGDIITGDDDLSDSSTSHPILSKIPPFFNPTNRVDLIARTIAHLERLHHSNQKRKQEIVSLKQQLEASKKAGEDTAQKLKDAIFNNSGGGFQKQVMMMVPMMVPAGAAGGAPAMPMMNPFMMQQPFMQPQPSLATTAGETSATVSGAPNNGVALKEGSASGDSEAKDSGTSSTSTPCTGEEASAGQSHANMQMQMMMGQQNMSHQMLPMPMQFPTSMTMPMPGPSQQQAQQQQGQGGMQSMMYMPQSNNQQSQQGMPMMMMQPSPFSQGQQYQGPAKPSSGQYSGNGTTNSTGGGNLAHAA